MPLPPRPVDDLGLIEPAEESLAQRVRSGVGWNAGSALLTYALGLGRSMVIARLLAPDDFGLFGMAATVLGAMTVLTNMGLDVSLIVNRFPNDSELSAHLDTIWTAEIFRRLAVALLLTLCASPASWFYGDARLSVIVLIFGLTQFVQGFQNIGPVLLRKRLRFERVIWYEQTTNFVSTIIVILFAFWMRDVWALVLGQLLSSAAGVLLSYRFHPYRPRFAFDRRAFRQAFTFGKYMLVILSMSYITTTADNVVVGKLLGPTILGVYVLAYNLASLPIGIIGGVLNSVLYPAYAELGAQHQERLERAFVRVFTISSAILLVLTVPMFLLADELVLLLYGTKWAAAGSLLRILALIGFWRGLLQVVVPLLVSLRGPRLEARAKVVEAFIFLAMLYPLTRNFGAEGAAYAGVIVYLLTMVNRFRLIQTLAPQAFEKLPRIVSTTLGAGGLAIIAGALALNYTDALSARLLFGGVVPTGVAVGLMLWMHPALRRELTYILARRRL